MNQQQIAKQSQEWLEWVNTTLSWGRYKVYLGGELIDSCRSRKEAEEAIEEDIRCSDEPQPKESYSIVEGQSGY